MQKGHKPSLLVQLTRSYKGFVAPLWDEVVRAALMNLAQGKSTGIKKSNPAILFHLQQVEAFSVWLFSPARHKILTPQELAVLFLFFPEVKLHNSIFHESSSGPGGYFWSQTAFVVMVLPRKSTASVMGGLRPQGTVVVYTCICRGMT